MSGIPLLSSRFFVNPNDPAHPNMMPSDLQPSSGWFINDLNLNPYTCSGIQGPSWIPFEGWDPSEICKYYNFIKSIKNQNPQQFLVKLMHLLKYSKKNPAFVLPNCIKLDSTFLALCTGVTKMVDQTVKLESIGQTGIDNTSLTNLQGKYSMASSKTAKDNVEGQIKTVIDGYLPDILLDAQKDSLRLDSINNELLLINCPDSLIKMWKEIYLIYIKFLQQDSVALSDRSVLTALSQECSDIYGDAIHLARAMANTYSDTYFDVFDLCSQGPIIRQKATNNLGDISIYPNPSLGLFNILLPDGFNGTLNVMDATGKIVLQKKIVKSNFSQLDLASYSGLLFFKFVNDFGYVSIHKVIVIK